MKYQCRMQPHKQRRVARAHTSVRHPRKFSRSEPAAEVMDGCGPSYRPSVAWPLARASAAAMSRAAAWLPSGSSDHSLSTEAWRKRRAGCGGSGRLDAGVAACKTAPHERSSTTRAHLQRAAEREGEGPGRAPLLLRHAVDGVQVQGRLLLRLREQEGAIGKVRAHLPACVPSGASRPHRPLPQPRAPQPAGLLRPHPQPGSSHHTLPLASPTCPPDKNMMPGMAAGTQRRMQRSVAAATSSGAGRGPRWSAPGMIIWQRNGEGVEAGRVGEPLQKPAREAGRRRQAPLL